MRGHLDSARVRIEAPDARTAFVLERRLRHLHPIAVGRGRCWEVDVEEFEGVENELVAAICDWLQDVRHPYTTLWVDGRPRSVGSDVETAERRASTERSVMAGS